MLTPFEIAATVLCPTIRAKIAEKLVGEKMYTQKEAAEKLGLTQQAVSNYMTGCRAAWKDTLEASIANEGLDEVVELAHQGADEFAITMMISRICLRLLNKIDLWKGGAEDAERCTLCKSKEPQRCIVTEFVLL